MTLKKKKRMIACAVAVAVVTMLIFWTVWGNTAVELNTCTVTSDRLPEAFSGYRIAHISDLHNAQMGNGNEKLLSMLRSAQPDMIAITGDLIDSRNTDLEVALAFVEEAVTIAPCYYVTGNHEARVEEYTQLKVGLEELGVTVLENGRAEIEKDGQRLIVLGLNDPSFQTDYLFGDSESVIRSGLEALQSETDGFTLLLSHRPEMMDVYAQRKVDLVLSGHAHGGQFRLPFVGGLVAPNQGLFPEYDAGLYTKEDTVMVVSRGVGNSIVPLRVNNHPEVILIELRSQGPETDKV